MSGLRLPFRGILPRIAEDAFIAPNATVIGDVVIGREANIWFGCIIRGDVHEIRIGDRANIQDGTVVHVSKGKFGCYIGDDVTIGHMALIHGCTLEAGAFVGMKSTVMDGCIVEGGAMLAAGSLLTPGKRVPRGELWGGSPAKLLRPLTEEQRATLGNTAASYSKLGAEYRLALKG
ncbi:MAG: gamma carbonic anhydrase family protein [Hyphomicrobium sp.]|nr:gamma carbonic anhydrase family protein [Hyphomicrobium sp.]